jgi:murein DD-endopeptidase MepM/ murein hydrolase activator NlpD
MDSARSDEHSSLPRRSRARILRNPLAWIGFCWVLFVLLCSISAPAVAASLRTPPVFVPPPSVDEREPLAPPLHAQIVDYEVQSGDTVWDIAGDFGTDPDSLAIVNEMSNWDRLQPGQTLRVLTIPGFVHRVAPDDSVDDIAEKYGISAEDIMAVNSIRPGDDLTVGRDLILPYARPAREAVLAARGESFRWPILGPITSYFGYRWGGFHTGVDIGAPTGTPITASRGGRVVFAGWRGNYGNLVIVDHRDGKTTWYAHLSRFAVQAGAWVDRGQVLGYVGTTGRSTGPHLHFEIREADEPQNPLDFLP